MTNRTGEDEFSKEERSLQQPSLNTSLTDVQNLDQQMYDEEVEANYENNASSSFSQLDIRYGELAPYAYQISIFEEIQNNWKVEEASGRNFGNIVYLETGTGKTYIAVMLLKHLFSENVPRFEQSWMSGISKADGPQESN